MTLSRKHPHPMRTGRKPIKNWKEVKVRWVLDETFSEKDTYDGETPGTYVLMRN